MAKVVIIGAGIGGLTAALALLRAGHEVIVCEQAEVVGEVGAGVQISPNGTRILGALGLREPMLANSFTPPGKEIRLWNTGETWPLFDLAGEAVDRYGSPYLMFHRADLHAMLLAGVRGIDPGAIRLGAKFTRYEHGDGTVTAMMDDGDTVTGDVLIGADGVHSVLRRILFGQEAARFTGCVAWRMVMPAAVLPDGLVRPVGTNWVGPGAHVVHYFLRGGALFNFVGLVERDDWQVESWSVQGTKQELAADFVGWHPDIGKMIDCVPTEPYKWALMLRDPLPNWTVGRVSLLGDASHPTQPTMAQGAVMAMEDGVILARALTDYDDPEVALQAYQAARIERATKLVQISNDNVTRFHNPALADRATAEVFILEQWDPKRIAERYEWLFTYDAATVPV